MIRIYNDIETFINAGKTLGMKIIKPFELSRICSLEFLLRNFRSFIPKAAKMRKFLLSSLAQHFENIINFLVDLYRKKLI